MTIAIWSSRTSRIFSSAQPSRKQIGGLSVPTNCLDVPSEVLLPRNTWTDKAGYDAAALKLKGLFEKETQKYV